MSNNTNETEPVIFENSFLDEIQTLTNQLYAKINNKSYEWNNKTGSVIVAEAIKEVNDLIDELEDSYSTGCSKHTTTTTYYGHTYTGSYDYGTHNGKVGGSYNGTFYTPAREYDFDDCWDHRG